MSGETLLHATSDKRERNREIKWQQAEKSHVQRRVLQILSSSALRFIVADVHANSLVRTRDRISTP